MGCKCAVPKSLKNDANGVIFYVCAQSLGGCGEEIGNEVSGFKPPIFEGYDSSKGICPECEGGGMHFKLYPSGHTEVTCECCSGTGVVEYED